MSFTLDVSAHHGIRHRHQPASSRPANTIATVSADQVLELIDSALSAKAVGANWSPEDTSRSLRDSGRRFLALPMQNRSQGPPVKVTISALGGIVPPPQAPAPPPQAAPPAPPQPKAMPKGTTPSTESTQIALLAYMDELAQAKSLPEGSPEQADAEERADYLWEMIHGDGGDLGGDEEYADKAEPTDGLEDSPAAYGVTKMMASRPPGASLPPTAPEAPKSPDDQAPRQDAGSVPAIPKPPTTQQTKASLEPNWAPPAPTPAAKVPEPIQAYHGTSREFSEFKPEETAGTNIDSGFMGTGSYFTSNPETAKYYARSGQGRLPEAKRAVHHVSLDLKNPFDWGPKTLGARAEVYGNKGIPDSIRAAVHKRAGFTPPSENEEPDFLKETDLSKAIRDELISRGHDGVMATLPDGHKEYVAFHGHQIKSHKTEPVALAELKRAMSMVPAHITSFWFMDTQPGRGMSEWTRYQGPRGGMGWRNTRTGKVLYTKSPNAPGAARRDREQSAGKAKAISERVLAHYQAPHEEHAPSEEELQELATHLPKLNIDQLKNTRNRLLAEWGDAPRKEHMVAALRKHVAGLVQTRQEHEGRLFPGFPGRDAVAEQAAEAKAAAPPKAGAVKHLPLDQIHVDPERFQFKQHVNKKGVTDKFKDVSTFDPVAAGELAVWHDPENDKTYSVNGHHRHELASRTEDWLDPSKDPTDPTAISKVPYENRRLKVRYIKAANAEEARSQGALLNMKEGNGTALDAAKYMRDRKVDVPALKRQGVSLQGAVAKNAVHLHGLSDPIFNRVARGQMEEPRAVAIGEHLPGRHDLQNQLINHIDKREEASGREWTPKQVAEAARIMANSPTTTSTGEGDLFGGGQEMSRIEERAALTDHVRRALATQRNDFEAMASKRRAANVADAGNVLNVDENKRLGLQHAQNAELFDKTASYKGPVADLINHYSERYANATGEKARKSVADQLHNAVATLLSGGPDAVGTGAAGRGAAPGGDVQQPAGVGALAGGQPVAGTVPEPGQAGAGSARAVDRVTSTVAQPQPEAKDATPGQGTPPAASQQQTAAEQANAPTAGPATQTGAMKPETMTKEQAKEAMRSVPFRKDLEYGHDKYFHTDQADETVPMDKIRPTRARPEGLENANRFMNGAASGVLPKRSPVKVVKNDDGTYTVADGNSTFANAQAAGWKDLPVTHVSQEHHRGEQRDSVEKEDRKAHEALAHDKLFSPDEMTISKKAANEQKMREEVAAIAPKVKEQYDAVLDHGSGVDAAIGATVIDPAKLPAGMDKKAAFAAALDKPGPVVVLSPIKDLAAGKRAEEKVNSDYGGDWSKLHDAVRGTVGVDATSDIPKAIAALKEKMAAEGWTLAKTPKNKFTEPTLEGYRDINLSFRSPDGLISEVQVNTKDMLKAKAAGHALYEPQREILGKAKRENRPLSAEEADKVVDLIHQQRQHYTTAWLKSLGVHDESHPELVDHALKMAEKRYNEHWGKEAAGSGIQMGASGVKPAGGVSDGNVNLPGNEPVPGVSGTGRPADGDNRPNGPAAQTGSGEPVGAFGRPDVAAPSGPGQQAGVQPTGAGGGGTAAAGSLDEGWATPTRKPAHPRPQAEPAVHGLPGDAPAGTVKAVDHSHVGDWWDSLTPAQKREHAGQIAAPAGAGIRSRWHKRFTDEPTLARNDDPTAHAFIAEAYDREHADATKPNSVSQPSLLDRAIEYGRTYKPSVNAPSPSIGARMHDTHPFDEAGGDRSDLADAGAVLAGSKPAALVDASFLDSPIGQEVAARLKETGHTIGKRTKNGNIAIGKPDHVSQLTEEYAKSEQGGELGHKRIGELLGYPKEAIDEFVKRNPPKETAPVPQATPTPAPTVKNPPPFNLKNSIAWDFADEKDHPDLDKFHRTYGNLSAASLKNVASRESQKAFGLSRTDDPNSPAAKRQNSLSKLAWEMFEEAEKREDAAKAAKPVTPPPLPAKAAPKPAPTPPPLPERAPPPVTPGGIFPEDPRAKTKIPADYDHPNAPAAYAAQLHAHYVGAHDRNASDERDQHTEHYHRARNTIDNLPGHVRDKVYDAANALSKTDHRKVSPAHADQETARGEHKIRYDIQPTQAVVDKLKKAGYKYDAKSRTWTGNRAAKIRLGDVPGHGQVGPNEGEAAMAGKTGTTGASDSPMWAGLDAKLHPKSEPPTPEAAATQAASDKARVAAQPAHVQAATEAAGKLKQRPASKKAMAAFASAYFNEHPEIREAFGPGRVAGEEAFTKAMLGTLPPGTPEEGEGEGTPAAPPDGGPKEFRRPNGMMDLPGGHPEHWHVAAGIRAGGKVTPQQVEAARKNYERLTDRQKTEYGNAIAGEAAMAGESPEGRDALVQEKLAGASGQATPATPAPQPGGDTVRSAANRMRARGFPGAADRLMRNQPGGRGLPKGSLPPKVSLTAPATAPAVDHTQTANDIANGGTATRKQAEQAAAAYSGMTNAEKVGFAKAIGVQNAATALPMIRDQLVGRALREGVFRGEQAAKGLKDVPDLHEGASAASAKAIPMPSVAQRTKPEPLGSGQAAPEPMLSPNTDIQQYDDGMVRDLIKEAPTRYKDHNPKELRATIDKDTHYLGKMDAEQLKTPAHEARVPAPKGADPRKIRKGIRDVIQAAAEHEKPSTPAPDDHVDRTRELIAAHDNLPQGPTGLPLSESYEPHDRHMADVDAHMAALGKRTKADILAHAVAAGIEGTHAHHTKEATLNRIRNRLTAGPRAYERARV